MDPDARPPARPLLTRSNALHLITLWSFAVAQPLYDVLRRNREFFVAHRTDTVDAVLLVLLVSVVLPAVLVGLSAAAAALDRRAGRAALLTLVGALAAVLALQAAGRVGDLPTRLHVGVAVVAGAGVAWAYAAAAPVRLFLSILSPASVVFPLLFLLHPDMAPFVRPTLDPAAASARLEGDPPPIVMVIFDQLPLTSLMTEAGEIDAANFPGFAALASSSTWYRNATTVGDYTGFAVPPIVSGERPHRRRLPVAQDYPRNLFTWLGGTYRLEVQESITALCPPSLCPPDRPPIVPRLLSMSIDVAVVYLHIVLPAEYRAELPPLTENWKDFARRQRWSNRWVQERDTDRRTPVRTFIDSLDGTDPQPTVYFLHALLPHEPYMYLRDGRQFTTRPRLIGLIRPEMWRKEEWLIAEQYRLHLIQLAYVDQAVADLLDRLRAEGLWDRALVVVTADHGASFRPGLPFKAARPDSLADIAPVPLFIKAPGQQQPQVSDVNLETPDILPTLAEMLGVRLPWTPEGRSVLSGVRPATKVLQQGGGRLRRSTTVDELAADRTAAVARKVRLFGRGPNPYWIPQLAPHRDLLGRSVASLRVNEESPLQALVTDASQYRAVDPDGPVVPSQIMGRLVDDLGRPQAAALAVAVNGTIAATTRAHATPTASTVPTWTTFIDPAAFHEGSNDIEVFVVTRMGRSLVLDRAYTSSDRPDSVNLASRAAGAYWGITQTGLQERGGTPPIRWTEGEAVMVAPINPESRPRSLRVGLSSGPHQGPLRIAINGCVLYDGPVDSEPWYRTFSLRDCGRGTLDGRTARITLQSAARAVQHLGETRRIGVFVETVNLYALDWPVGRQRGDPRMAAQLLTDPEKPRVRGTAAELGVANTGSVVLFSALDAPDQRVEFDLRWAPAGGTTKPAGQRLRLPRTLYPRERAETTLPLMPPPDLEGRGPWDLSVVPVTADGREVPLDEPCVIRVVPDE